MSPRRLFLPLLACAAAACATAEPIVRLHPDVPDVFWRSGHGIIERELPGARVAIAFVRQEEDRLAFRVEVENTAEERLDVDPKSFEYVACLPSGPCRKNYRVLDPETALVALEAARARERAAAENDAAFHGVLLLLSVTAQVGAIAKGNEPAAAHASALGSSVAHGAADSEARSDRRIARMGAEQERWETAALRRTTLFPGRALAGEVYVPTDYQVSRLSVGVRLRGALVWFPFRQVIVANLP